MDFLKLLEGIRTPFFDTLMSGITLLGSEYAFLLIAICVFWCFDKRLGYYMMTVGFIGTLLNQLLKLACRIPRPWIKDPGFTIVESARADATGYSFPSGHTQSAVNVYGTMARYKKNAVLRSALIILIILVSFSRLYLGVHTLADVGVSLIIGTLLVFLIYPAFKREGDNFRMYMNIFAGMLVMAAIYLCFAEFYPFPLDADAENIADGIKNAYTLFGAAAALCVSFPLEHRLVRFETSAVWWVQVIKCALGLVCVVLIKTLLKTPLFTLFGGHNAADAVRYFLMVIFAAAVWPATFKWFAKLGRSRK